MDLLGHSYPFGSLCGIKIIENNMIIMKAKYEEWLISLIGACFIAFSLGMLFFNYFQKYIWIIMIIGIMLHSWGMYKTHKRNNKN